jgi:hypothetical protein
MIASSSLRALSHATASCSGRGGSVPAAAAAAAVGRRAGLATAAAPALRAPVRRAPRPPRAEPDAGAGPAWDDSEYAEALEELLSRDPKGGAPRLPNQIMRGHNSRPDFSDPNWANDVDDWGEFWGATAFDESELEDLLSLEDEADAAALLSEADGGDGGGAGPDDDPEETAAARLSRKRLARAHTLVAALRDMTKHEAAVHILGPVRDKASGYHNAYQMPPGTVRLGPGAALPREGASQGARGGAAPGAGLGAVAADGERPQGRGGAPAAGGLRQQGGSGSRGAPAAGGLRQQGGSGSRGALAAGGLRLQRRQVAGASAQATRLRARAVAHPHAAPPPLPAARAAPR